MTRRQDRRNGNRRPMEEQPAVTFEPLSILLTKAEYSGKPSHKYRINAALKEQGNSIEVQKELAEGLAEVLGFEVPEDVPEAEESQREYQEAVSETHVPEQPSGVLPGEWRDWNRGQMYEYATEVLDLDVPNNISKAKLEDAIEEAISSES